MVKATQSSKTTESLKFLCSYGGKILPRHTGGNLRYTGGFTRILVVNHSISFTELMVKLVEFCGSSVTLMCQLPSGDLETLISIKSGEELAELIDEYDRVSPGSKIRAVLAPPKSLKHVSSSSSLGLSPKSPFGGIRSPPSPPNYGRFYHRSPPPPDYYTKARRHSGELGYCDFVARGGNPKPSHFAQNQYHQ